MPIKTITEAQIKAFNDTGIEYEYLIDAKQVANELLKLATGQHPEASPSAGLVLDTEGILQIKRYEKKGLSLPDTREEVYTYLGEYESEIQGLTNADLLDSFVSIKTHAGTWARIQDKIIKTAINLDVFADEMLDDGGRANEFLEQILLEYSELMDLDPEKLEDPAYIQEILESLDVDANVAEEQALRLEATKRTIDNLVEKTEGYYQETNGLLTELLTFRDELTARSDDVAAKETLCDQLHLEEEVEAKKEEVRRLKGRLKELNEQYDQYVTYALAGLAGGLIGVTITGSIFGKKAEDTRKEIKEVEGQIKTIENEIDQLSRMLYAVQSLDNTFEGLYTVMIQAEKGVSQLVTVWTTIKEYLQSSYDACQAIVHAPDVLDLWINLEDAVEPWNEVKGNAALVTQQFNDALDQWEQEVNQS
ncbi:hypothetical protein PCC7424_3040 [Gloeothece citriformis PCC 7424]|uniref:Alpha-xenorhabdolysin family binary toxin subunit A n=1 Tax=Gloeothece citriformis (strain PCC 7424) TaxID=65393 RepID=B7KB86_GLOC7|nr:alpha-xenorhabdolysin family binary toxin subunit A [Gloeothece citriformis]ACK71442.1 hypothetical protein PCC7424_3040 [Gloeothece citriformis PCC 7424]